MIENEGTDEVSSDHLINYITLSVICQAACENSALLKLFLFYVFDIVLAYTIAGSFLSKLQQLTDLVGK